MIRSLSFIVGCIVSLFVGLDFAAADIFSDVWMMEVDAPANGAFGTNGSVAGNKLSAEIITGDNVAKIGLVASNADWFKLSDSVPSGSNNQLVPFLENDAPLTNLTFSSSHPLKNVDLLLHNVWNATDGSVPGGQRTNYIGNFRVTYADGTVVNNALPTRRAINQDSPFETDFEGGTLQPSDLNSVFDGGNILSVSEANFDPGNGATPGYYWSDLSQSMMSEMQGFGIFSFDESNGGITEIDFTWVGHTVGTNTAFLGLAGTATSVPEPSGALIILAAAIASCTCRRRQSQLA